MGAALALLLAIFRALPAMESLVRTAVAERDKEREREAARRQQEKDARVDVAIKAELDHEASDEPKQP